MKLRNEQGTESNHAENNPANEADETRSPFSTRWSERRASKKVQKALPQTPKKRAHLVQKLIDSPHTTKLLTQKGCIMSKQLAKRLKLGEVVLQSLHLQVQQTKSKGTRHHDKLMAHKLLKQVAASGIAKKYGLRTFLMRRIGLRRNHADAAKVDDWWKGEVRKRRKDCLTVGVKNVVTEFFLSSEISRENPGKRYVVDVDGCKVQRHSMTVTLKEAYKMFQEKYPTLKIGFTRFRTSKPVQVVKVSETNRRTCLCMQCCNIAVKAEAIKKLIKVKGDEDSAYLPCTKQDLAKLTLCAEPQRECYMRTCKKCSTKAIDKTFNNLKEKTEEEIQWAKWEYVSIQKDGKVKRVISCVPRKTKIEVLLDDLQVGLEIYPAHAFEPNGSRPKCKSVCEHCLKMK